MSSGVKCYGNFRSAGPFAPLNPGGLRRAVPSVGLLPASAEGRSRKQAAFTLMEVLFASVIVGVLIVALYSAMANSIPMVRSCQENERVTQMLAEKLDTIRLYNWTQITNGFVPSTFLVGVDPSKTNSTPYYTGTVSIVRAPITEMYSNNLLQVTVTVNWVSNRRPQSQSMTTYVAKYGLQSYIMR